MNTAVTSADPQVAMRAEMAARVLCRRRLLPFVKRLNSQYKAGWVHEDICARLEQFSKDVEAGLSPRLMILMPPRHGKSELASRNFPAWHLGRCPDHEIISCSYNVSLAMAFSRKVKELIASPSYEGVFNTRLHPDFQAAEEWGIAGQRGGYVAAGVGGGITGKGAHVLIIDDPVKNSEEADSADMREKIWDWYTSTAYTRLAPGGGVLVIQTCWHDDDLAGKLQAAMAEDPENDQFVVVKYPAIAEEDEFLDEDTGLIERGACPAKGRLLRRKGDALHPQRYDLRKLNQTRKTLPKRFWSALYQQNPVPDDGIYFLKEMFREAPQPRRENCYVQVAFDFAISEKTHNDYTVGTVTLLQPDDTLHVADVVRFRSADADFIIDSILTLCSKWYSPSLILGLEDGQIYRALSAPLKREMLRRRQFISVELLKPITDKLARARTLQARMQQGTVTFTKDAPWLEALRSEMLRFPAGAHDDQVDSLAWNAIISNRPAPREPAPKKNPSWRDRLLGHGGTTHMAS